MDQEVVTPAPPPATPPPETNGETPKSPPKIPEPKSLPIEKPLKLASLVDLCPEVIHHVVEHVSVTLDSQSVKWSSSGKPIFGRWVILLLVLQDTQM